jgi:hypothetical protein
LNNFCALNNVKEGVPPKERLPQINRTLLNTVLEGTTGLQSFAYTQV